jgi:hypothetical protein
MRFLRAIDLVGTFCKGRELAQASDLMKAALALPVSADRSALTASIDILCSDILAITPSRIMIRAAKTLFREAPPIRAHENVIRNAAAIIGRWE